MSVTASEKITDFLIVGNHPFLDFINTCPEVDGEAIELLTDGGRFLDLLGRLDLIDAPALRGVSSDEVSEFVPLARNMREDFRRLLLQTHFGGDPDSAIALVNSWFQLLGAPTAIRELQGMRIGFQPMTKESQWLSPLLRSGLELITSAEYVKTKQCARAECILWFLDTSKSGTRRWCSMSHCGNLDKAKHFRERKAKG